MRDPRGELLGQRPLPTADLQRHLGGIERRVADHGREEVRVREEVLAQLHGRAPPHPRLRGRWPGPQSAVLTTGRPSPRSLPPSPRAPPVRRPAPRRGTRPPRRRLPAGSACPEPTVAPRTASPSRPGGAPREAGAPP